MTNIGAQHSLLETLKVASALQLGSEAAPTAGAGRDPLLDAARRMAEAPEL